MKIYQAWEKLTDSFTNEQQQLQFWNEYYRIETEAYKKILADPEHKLSGSIKEAAESIGMEPVMFAGFWTVQTPALSRRLTLALWRIPTALK